MTMIDKAAPRATGREWTGLAVLMLPCLLYSMDLTVLNLAVPQLTAHLAPTASQLLWIVDIYGFFVAGSLITMGTLGDRIGRRKILMIGAAAFGAASVLAAFSTSAEMLIFSRALLGIAAATLAPSTLSLIRNMFLDPRQRQLAIGIWIAGFSAGGAIGPLIGGVLLQHFWWGSVFLLAVPMMVLILAVGPFLLPEFKDPEPGPLDPFSAALSVGAVLATIWGIKRIAEAGGDWAAALSILVGVGVGYAFVRRQQGLADPLIDVSLFRRPAIGGALATNVIALFIAFGSFLFIAQYFQLVLGMSPLEAGLWTAPTGIAFGAGSVLTPLVVRRIRPVLVMAGGFVMAAVGLGLMALLDGPHGFLALMTGMVLFCLGLSPIGTLTTDFVVGHAPPERAGAAAAISETSFEFGGAIGIAVLGSLVTLLYRTTMAATAPAGLPPGKQAALDTLGEAAALAPGLPAELGTALLDAARAAFTGAVEVTFALSALIAIATAGLVMWLLRAVEGGSGPHAAAPARAGETAERRTATVG